MHKDISSLGDYRSQACGNKARLLDFAASKRLPVPKGYVIAHEVFCDAIKQNLVRRTERSIEFVDRAALVLWLPDLSTGPFAVRSAFSAEDTSTSSMAGYFDSFLSVEKEDIVDRLMDVWRSSLGLNRTDVRLDVLLMEMVKAKIAGVAFSESNYEDDLVNYTDGTADTLVSGQTRGYSIELPRVRAYENKIPPFLVAHSSHSEPAWNAPLAKHTSDCTALDSDEKVDTEEPTVVSTCEQQALGAGFEERLAIMLREVRSAFDDKNWDIEWADDGHKCWLIQIRPITVPSRRNEYFTIANHKEILPDLPSPFMTSVIASCQHGLLAYYQKFDKDLPVGRNFIEVFKGRPFLNLSYLTEMMRHWGLPTSLVTRSIGGSAAREFPLNPARFARKLPVLASMALTQNAEVLQVQNKISLINEAVEKPLPTMTECVATLQFLYKTLVTGMMSVTAAMSGPLAMCRKLGVLEEHSSRHETIASRMYLDLEPLRECAGRSDEIRACLERGDLPTDSQFQTLWLQYLAKHGHRGIFESDVSRPRMAEQPGTVLKSLVHSLPRRAEAPRRTVAGVFSLPIWWQASRAIKAREELRYHAMKAFGIVRQRIIELSSPHLTNSADVWNLTIEEAVALDKLIIPDAEFIRKRKEELEELSSYSLPDLLRRFDDLSAFSSLPSTAGVNKLKGVSLTTGSVRGKALVLFEPTASLPSEFLPETTILIARSVDAGWIPTFALVRGVIVEIGGDLSHGSIILRETGIPSVTNVAFATRSIRTGDEVLLDAGTGTIELIERVEE